MNEDEVKSELLARGGDDRFVERLGEMIGANVRASAIFGEPVERDGATVIPVARAVWGFGGGNGASGEELGWGGGGGGIVSPLGYIEVRDGEAEFKPIRDRRLLGLGLAALGVAALALTRRHW